MSTLTVKRLAEAKRLPESFLRDLGIHDTAAGVAIPYLDEEGNLLFERTRLSLDAGQRFSQPDGVPLAPYGLERLKAARERGQPLILLEGESDSWTLWHTDFAALGLPGASTAGKLEPEHLLGFTQLFAVQEPGKSGAAFINGIRKRLFEIGFTGESYVISLDGFKDPSELYCDGPELFSKRFTNALHHPTVLTLEGTTAVQRFKGFRPLVDYLADLKQRSERKSFWSGVLREGEASILAGRAMAGKSTFACALARALANGGCFVGRDCRRSKVGYMALERNGATVAELFSKWGLVDEILFLDEVPPLNGEQLAAFLRGQIEEHALEVIIVDHLQNLVRVADANDYARVTVALEPFQKVAKSTGAHLMLLHHQGKTRREGEIDVMGSEAFRAAADVLIEATRSEGHHYVRGNVRVGEDLPRTLVTVDLETGAVEAVDAQQADTASALDEIIAFLETQNEPLIADEIRDAVQLKAIVVSAALKSGVAEDGPLVRIGAGKRGNPYLYQLRQFDSRLSLGKAGIESQDMPSHARGEGLNRFPARREENRITDRRESNNAPHVSGDAALDKGWVE
jgi:hypothetical protein